MTYGSKDISSEAVIKIDWRMIGQKQENYLGEYCHNPGKK